MRASSVCFSLPKLGSTAREWEDGAGSRDDGRPRFIVVDGATEAYDAPRWVDQLVSDFIGVPGNGPPPELRPEAMRDWFERMQRRWLAESPTRFHNVIEEHKFHQDGSFATMLGCELTGLAEPEPRWSAVALGDTVLFHVRDNQLLSHFPPLEVASFGLAPGGVHTRADALRQMMDEMVTGGGPLRLGDLLFVATDALAHWMLRRCGERRLWSVLGALDHDSTFAALVEDHWAAGELRNDDVTLLRVRMVAAEPAYLVVCL